MKKILMICLLALMSAGGMSCANAQTNSGAPTEAVPSGVTPNVANFCSSLDKALSRLKDNPSGLTVIGDSIEKKTLGLDPQQKLTAADKALIKQTMHRLMKVVVTSQMEQNPQMIQMFGTLTEEQKKEMIEMGMKSVTDIIDGKIDECETLGDFSKIQM